MKKDRIIGVPVDNLTYEKILDDLSEHLIRKKKMTVISINPQVVLESQNYPKIVEFIEEATHRIPDGIGIVLVSKLTGGRIKKRITGFDLMNTFLKYANQNKRSVFFYGAKPEVLEDMIKNIRHDYHDIDVLGGINGYTNLSETEIVREINSVKPDFLFVALGFPKQEQWLMRNVNQLEVNVFQDVGGSFDVLSGHVKRAPTIFLQLRLEWLYRSLSNPQRFSRITQLPVFLIKSLMWRLKNTSK